MDVSSIHLHSLLSAASYVRFGDTRTADAVIKALRDAESVPEASARWIFEQVGWSIWDYHPNDDTGFSATLFANGTSKVLAIRGTETGGLDQTADDLLQADLGEIRLDGLAITQAVALFNYVQCLRADAGATDVVQLTLHTGLLPPASAPYVTRDPLRLDRFVWLEAEHNGTGLGLLGPGDTVTVTGHSLGGHLAALALRLFPDVFADAFTFNAPGFDPPLTSDGLTNAFIGLFSPYLAPDPATSFAAVASRIHTIESEGSAPGDDIELISSDVTGAPASPETYVGTEKNSHSIGQIVDALAVQSLFASLDPSLTPAALARLYAAASDVPGMTDERIVESLSRLVLGDGSALPTGEVDSSFGSAPFDARVALHDRIAAVRERIATLDGAAVLSLLDAAGSDAAALARSEIGYRYALAALQPYALTGNAAAFGEANADGALDRYDPATRQGTLTDAWIDDRTHLLRQLLARNAGDLPMVTDGAHRNETYVDLPSGQKFSTADVAYLGPDLPPDSVRFVFGGPSVDQVTGGNADDRLYGGAGDDLLDGGRGSDYLEGGRGFDVYVSRSGEGIDRLLDVDGDGRIQRDGVLAGVGYRVGDGLYLGSGGQLALVIAGEEAAQGGTLIVDAAVRVEGFRNGDLGILLRDEGPAPAPRDYRLVGDDGADVLSYEDVEALEGRSVPLTVSIQSEGGAGNDWLVTVNGNDLARGGAGDDLVSTGEGDDAIEAGDGADMVFSGPGTDVADGGVGADLIFGNQYLLYDTSGTASRDARAWEDLAGRFTWHNDGLHESDDGLLELRVRFELPQAAMEGLSTQEGLSFRYDPVSGDIAYFDTNGELVETLRQQPRFEPWSNDDPKRYAGGSGEDLLAGAGGADVLHGGADDDWLAGNDGDDLLVGGTGNDGALGGRGDDHLDGGAGDDTLIAEDGADHLFGGEGDDTLFGDSDSRAPDTHGGDHLYGGAGNDQLVGHGGDDALLGDEGDDTLWGGEGDDALSGGAGVDQLQGGDGGDRLDGGLDGDALHGELGADVLCGDGGDDALYGGADGDRLSGDAGRDALHGEAGDDEYLFRCGDGIDHLEDTAGSSTLAFGAGISPSDIQLYAMENGALLVAYGNGDGVQISRESIPHLALATFATGERLDLDDLYGDHLQNTLSSSGTDGPDVLRGGAVADYLWGYGGDDTLTGGGGDDYLYGNAGADALRGGAGADNLEGDEGDDLLAGGPGDDVLAGGAGADTYLIELGDGRDTIEDYGGTRPADVIRFGAGIAAADLSFVHRPDGDLEIAVGTAGDRVTVPDWYGYANAPVARFELADGTTLDASFLAALDVAPMEGTPGADVLVGTEFRDRLIGGAGDDTLDGGRGDDHLAGGAGDDRYPLGPASGMDCVVDTEGRNVVELAHGLWLSEVTRRRDGDDLLLERRGAPGTGLRIEGFYATPTDWRIVAENGAEGSLEDVPEASWWGAAPDPVAAAKAAYLETMRAGFATWAVESGYLRVDADTFRRQPVGATLSSSTWETRQSTYDYATGTLYEWTSRSSSTPRIEQIEYAGGLEQPGSRLHDDTIRFEVTTVPFARGVDTRGSYVNAFVTRSDQTIAFQPTAVTLQPTQTSERVYVRGTGSLTDGGYSGVRLDTETTLVATTQTEGALGGSGTSSLPIVVSESRFRVEHYVGTDGDDSIQLRRSSHTLVDGGAGNDRLVGTWGWSWDDSGVFFDGGSGNDFVTGSYFADHIVGGEGSDRLDGSEGADAYLIDPAHQGIDLIDDRAQLRGDNEICWSTYKSWYFESLGLDLSEAYDRFSHGPALPAVPRIDATHYETIETLIAADLIPTDEIVFGGDVAPSDLVLSWGFHEVLGWNGGLRATLNLSWGPDQGMRVVMPPEPPPGPADGAQPFTPWVQPDWWWVEGGAGAGVERFRFGADLVLSMADMLALAPPAPLHPSEALQRATGTEGDDVLEAAASGGYLLGNGGNDRLAGGAAADVLAGGAGNDTLAGGLGSDLYRIDRGGGSDLILETGGALGDIDALQLGEGLIPSLTTAVRNGNDLLLRLGSGGEQAVLRDWFGPNPSRIEQIVFADGSIWDAPEIDRRVIIENQAPVAVDPPAAAVDEAVPFTIPLPAGTFVDPDGDALALSATLADGAPLPAWLRLDAATQSLSGSAPLDAGGSYRITLTATDPLGASAQAVLGLDVRDVNPPLLGGAAGDALIGTAHPELLDGGAGDDRLYGGAGSDQLFGGTGTDLLDGGEGDDALHFAADGPWPSAQTLLTRIAERLPGLDASVLTRELGGSLDSFVGGAGIDTLVGTAGSDAVLLTSLETLGSPRISGVERFELGAGDDLLVLTGLLTTYGNAVVAGQEGDDSLWTSTGADELDGGVGADDLHGGAGSDSLIGGGGNDLLDGGLGADVLDGGAGDDLLIGGRGGDTYAYRAGDGADRISDVGPTKETDRLVLGTGLGPDNLWLSRSGDDLVMRFAGNGGSVAVAGWYADASRRIERIETADGRVLLASDVERLVEAMAAFAPAGASEPLGTLTTVPQLAPVIAAAWLPMPA